jgi:hypothetical protein
MEILKPTKFQIVNENKHYFSVTMQGKPRFIDSKEMGYTYDKEKAREISAQLINLGYDVSVVSAN